MMDARVKPAHDEGALPRKSRKLPRHRLVNRAAERNDQLRHAREPLPAPGVELRLLIVAPFGHPDLALFAGEAERKPLLALAAEFCEPMRRAVVWRKIVSEPVGGLAEI